MRAPGKLLVIIALAIFAAGIAIAASQTIRDIVSPLPASTSQLSNDLGFSKPVSGDKTPDGNYNCRLRVYVAEPLSRWKDYTNYYYYEHGFLGFGIDTSLSIAYQETVNITRTWDVSQNPLINDISGTNIEVFAVLFNSDSAGINYSDPLFEDPYGAPFTIHYVDATAHATPGNPGSDAPSANSTHAVFVEEGTSITCPNCPYVRAALKSIYASGNYNFHYAAMITDKGAYGYMTNNYNLTYVPSCYFDGGDDILIGGYSQESYYTDRLLNSGQREVPDLNLSVSMAYLGNYQIEFTVSVTNNVFSNSAPNTPASPAGPSAGLLEDEHLFSVTGTDPESDQLYYMWNWGDEQSDWVGPFNSGETVSAGHTWSAEGVHNVSVKVKDQNEVESGWSNVSPIKIVKRGNANGDDLINVGDAVFMISYIFRGGAAPVPLSAGNANCDELTNVGDAVYLISFIFRGGLPPGCY